MKLIVLFAVILHFVQSGLCQVSGVDGFNAVLGVTLKAVENAKGRGVVVECQTSQPIVVSCASKNDKIRVGGNPNPTLKKGQAFGWAFKANEFPGFSGRTQFWCTIVYKNGSKCGGDVFYQHWGDAPDVVHWTFKDNCVVLDWNNKYRPDIFHKQ